MQHDPPTGEDTPTVDDAGTVVSGGSEGSEATRPMSANRPAGRAMAAVPGPTASAAPAWVGRYELVRQVGEGGMGAVYLARQHEPIRRDVALKLVRPELAFGNVLKRFELERQALARMDHPGIAKVLDAGTSDAGQPFFVMEYVPGRPLISFADERRLSILERLELFRRVCLAIAHAHTKALLHRDIKSGNVLAYETPEGLQVKVIDFGIAKAVGEERLTDVAVTRGPGHTIGTPYAMSPEQADGLPDIDTRTDVYALGVLLFELLCGRLPLEPSTLLGSSLLEVVRAVKEYEPPRPSEWLRGDAERAPAAAANRQTSVAALSRQLARELEWIPLKALRKDRTRRYGSVEALIGDVDNYLAGQPLQAGPESRLYVLRKFATRNRLPLATAAGVALLTAAGVATYTIQLRLERDRTQAALETASGLVDFSLKVFDEANPYSGRADATLLDGVRAAVRDLEQRDPYRNHPTVRGDLELRIGEILRNVGQFKLAEQRVRKAIEVYGSAAEPPAERVATAYAALGAVLLRDRREAEAIPVLNEALSRQRALSPEGSPGVAEVLTNLGLASLHGGDHASASTHFEAALALLRHDPERHAVVIAQVERNLGGIAELTGDLNAALSRYEQAYDRLQAAVSLNVSSATLNRSAIEPDSLLLAELLNNTGLMRARLGDVEAGAADLRRAFEIYERRGAQETPSGLVCRRTLASVVRQAGRLEEAVGHYQAVVIAIKRRQAELGPEEMADDLANAQSGLGRTLLQMPARAAEAEAPLREAFEHRLKHASPGLALTAEALAAFYASAGRDAEAKKIQLEATKVLDTNARQTSN